MLWWGWLILSVNIVIILYVARKRATSIIENKLMKTHKIDNDEYVLAALAGLFNGIFWPLFLLGVLFIFIFFPSKASDFLEPFVPEFIFNEKEEEDRTDEEVRKEVDRLRREYTMPKWKRFILRMIRV